MTLALSVGALGATAAISASLPVGAESVGLWLCIALLLGYTIQAEKPDAIVLNGALMALYITFLTKQDLGALSELQEKASTAAAATLEETGKLPVSQ